MFSACCFSIKRQLSNTTGNEKEREQKRYGKSGSQE
jgi:hypothetical protein